jgi:transcriptional regulator CtsR
MVKGKGWGFQLPTLTEQIEQWLKDKLSCSHSNMLEIKRSEIAEVFACVPSQINYVLATRFTIEQGYLVESRRGGGGFLRIIKLREDFFQQIQKLINRDIGYYISQKRAERIIRRLIEEGLISSREQRLLKTAVARETLGIESPLRDALRARILKAMLLALLVD